MGAVTSQISSLTIAYSTVYSGTDQRKHQSSASLAFERGIHRWAVNSLHKGTVTRKSIHLVTSSWTITHCLGLGHETMVCAVCVSVFLWRKMDDVDCLKKWRNPWRKNTMFSVTPHPVRNVLNIRVILFSIRLCFWARQILTCPLVTGPMFSSHINPIRTYPTAVTVDTDTSGLAESRALTR